MWWCQRREEYSLGCRWLSVFGGLGQYQVVVYAFMSLEMGLAPLLLKETHFILEHVDVMGKDQAYLCYMVKRPALLAVCIEVSTST